jgi:hypothetical protein
MNVIRVSRYRAPQWRQSRIDQQVMMPGIRLSVASLNNVHSLDAKLDFDRISQGFAIGRPDEKYARTGRGRGAFKSRRRCG